MTDSEIWEKIDKLQALADDPAAFPGERENAKNRVEKLKSQLQNPVRPVRGPGSVWNDLNDFFTNPNARPWEQQVADEAKRAREERERKEKLAEEMRKRKEAEEALRQAKDQAILDCEMPPWEEIKIFWHKEQMLYLNEAPKEAIEFELERLLKRRQDLEFTVNRMTVGKETPTEHSFLYYERKLRSVKRMVTALRRELRRRAGISN